MNRPTETAAATAVPPRQPAQDESEPTDDVIIARSREDPEVFALLFGRHGPQLQRYIARRIGPDAAEDVLAEVFLAAFQQRRRYDPDRADVRPWLYGIATNLVGRHRRAEVRALRCLERTGVDPVTEAFVERSDANSPVGSQLASTAELTVTVADSAPDATAGPKGDDCG